MTPAPALGASAYRFGDFELDRRTLELRKSGQKVKLQPQPARVLRLLVSRPGELVSRDEIRREVWGEETFVDFERNLNYCLNCVRAVLGDTAQSPKYIETLPRRGYRFIAPVERQRPFPEPTLAVLPFANLNGDPAREYFADGITDALITELARIKSMRVISRQSVVHLKGSSQKLDDIASDLRVDGIVEGAVLHEGNRVRVTAQLVLVEPERHIWAETYDGDLSAVLATQREAARAIAACVASALSPDRARADAPRSVRAQAPVSPEIVESFLKAIAELGKMNADGLAKALHEFREITARAPDFALGLVGHASCLYALGWWGHVPAREVYPAAKQMLMRAVALDDSLDSAHMMLAFMIWLLDWDLAAAEREFRRAIELGPSNAEARIFYAVFLCCAGRYSESIAEAECGVRLDPTALISNQAAAWNYLNAGYPDMAEAQARRTIARFPDALQPHFVLGWSTWCQGRTEEAVATFEKALGLSREALSLSFLGHVYARVGRRDDALRLLQELDQLSSQGKASSIAHVVLHAGLADTQAAFEWLQTAFRLGDGLAWVFTKFPGLDPLRSDSRFAALVHRAGAR
ncbi:MAG: winged helix-turn-helix domain-containing protein [Bacteroidales bacterium]